MNTANNIRQLRKRRSQGEDILAVFKSDDMNLKTVQRHFTIIERAKDENISFGELKHLADQITNEVKNAIQTIETLKADLERMTAQRNQLEAGIKDIQENTKRELAIRDAKIEKLKYELQRETAERKAIADQAACYLKYHDKYYEA